MIWCSSPAPARAAQHDSCALYTSCDYRTERMTRGGGGAPGACRKAGGNAAPLAALLPGRRVARTSRGPAPMTPGPGFVRVRPTCPRPFRLLRRWGGNRRDLSVTPAVWVRPHSA